MGINKVALIEAVVFVVLMFGAFGYGIFVGKSDEKSKQINLEKSQNKRLTDGLRIELYGEDNTKQEAINKAKEWDSQGDWVAVNIKGMSYDRAVEVCNHEVGHEIFAEVCEKNMTKCLKIMENE